MEFSQQIMWNELNYFVYTVFKLEFESAHKCV